MEKQISIKDLVGFILELENRFNLLLFEINSVKVWQYQRHRIFLTLAREVGLYTQAHTKKNNLSELLKAAPSLFYYSLFSNPLSGNYQKDILVFSAGRKVKADEKFIDIYSEFLVKDLPEDSYEIIEELYLNRHLPTNKKHRRHQDYQQVRTTIKSKLTSFKFSEKQVAFIHEVEQEIKNRLNAEIDLKGLLLNGYLTFKFDFEFYDKLIKKRKPKQIYLVCSYVYKLALIAAAKKNKVETIEIQHGTIDKFHLGYSFPGQSTIDYFPDTMYFFGEYWKNCMNFPLKDENKIVYGFPYFRQQKEKYVSIQKKKGTILIISQGTIGKNISRFIWKSREFLKDYQITYKLHPGEYDRWKGDYPDLIKLSELDNVTVIDNNKTSLYTFLAESEYVIGVYSTAVYEALSFDCKVMCINLPGIEYLEDLIEKGFVKLVMTPEDISKFLKYGDFKKFDSTLFFA